jgi:hypothetical protein
MDKIRSAAKAGGAEETTDSPNFPYIAWISSEAQAKCLEQRLPKTESFVHQF